MRENLPYLAGVLFVNNPPKSFLTSKAFYIAGVFLANKNAEYPVKGDELVID